MGVYVHSVSSDLLSLMGSNRVWVGCTGSSPDLVIFWVTFWPGPFAAHRIQQDNDNNHKAELRANQRADDSFYSLKLMLNEVVDFQGHHKIWLQQHEFTDTNCLMSATILNILAEYILWSHHIQDCGKTEDHLRVLIDFSLTEREMCVW